MLLIIGTLMLLAGIADGSTWPLVVGGLLVASYLLPYARRM